MTEAFPFVSVIIPVYNGAGVIGACLDSLKELDYPKESFEIIVVDNGSSDKTVELAGRYTDSIYICPDVTISALRNYGAKKAKGKIYAFIDADCVADKKWLGNAVKLLKKGPCITGSKYDIPDNAVWIERAWYAQRPSGKIEVPYINSGNLIVPADIFAKTAGFNEKLITGEDYEFCTRAGRISRILSDDSIRVVHLGNPKTLRQFFRREIWHGLGALGSLQMKKFDKPLLGTFAMGFLSAAQIISLVLYICRGEYGPFISTSAGVFLLLGLTVHERAKRFQLSAVQKVQLMFLYYLYFIARAVSLVYLVSNRKPGYRKYVKV
ncbi:MAG TPA: glycosyltransferase [Dissulfurispiraceae bacterium]|nr:glycosyltransferase [Dissulfurispiraceae bacterium]